MPSGSIGSSARIEGRRKENSRDGLQDINSCSPQPGIPQRVFTNSVPGDKYIYIYNIFILLRYPFMTLTLHFLTKYCQFSDKICHPENHAVLLRLPDRLKPIARPLKCTFLSKAAVVPNVGERCARRGKGGVIPSSVRATGHRSPGRGASAWRWSRVNGAVGGAVHRRSSSRIGQQPVLH